MKKIFICFFLFLFRQAAFGQTHITFQDTIHGYFDEIKIAAKKGKRLWGSNLYGPMLLVNPRTRELYANYPDTAGILKKDGKIYYGRLPAAINIANTSINWSGQRWAMVMLPLPTGKSERIDLLAHELFHKAQPSLGFRLFNAENNHLDQQEGRIYLRIELEALNKALQASTASAKQWHLTNALTFRKYRYIIYPTADSTENVLELNEGLAAYTGLVLSARNKEQTLLHFNQGLAAFLSNPTFVRSFAYQTIPLYGYLLLATQKNWNKHITANTNLTELFLKAFHISLSNDLQHAAEISASAYNIQAVITEEIAREEKIKKLIAEYKSKFIDQPHFEIQFEQMNVSFDPRNIIPLEDKGTVYPNIRISDKWGILTVTNGALMSPSWDRISISVPTKNANNHFSGDGWTLILNDGYSVIKDENSNDYKLNKK